MRILLAMFLLVPAQTTLITFPNELQSTIHSPALSLFIGSSTFPTLSKTTAYNNHTIFNGTHTYRVVEATQSICEQMDEMEVDKFADALVLIRETTSDTISFKEEHRMALCAEKLGAVGVWRLQKAISEAGFGFRMRTGDFDNKVTIPVVVSIKSDLEPILKAFDADPSVVIIANATLDPNKWKDLFDSVGWFLVWRVFMCGVNLLGFLFALGVCTAHFANYRNHHTTVHFKAETRTIAIMFTASAIEVVGFLLRGVYFAIGPLFSTASITYATHVFLIFVTTPLEIVTTVLSVMLFMRWGAFGTRLLNNSCVEVFMGCVCMCLIAIGLAISTATAFPERYPGNAYQILTAYAVFGSVLCLVTAVAFFVNGFLFVRSLQTAKASNVGQRKRRQLRKATIWIMASGVSQLIFVTTLSLASNAEEYYSIRGWFLYNCLIFGSITATALSQTAAFRPIQVTPSSRVMATARVPV